MGKKLTNLTGKDKAVLSQIKRCGFCNMDLDGKPSLEIDFVVTPYRLHRLVARGYLRANDDALVDGCPPQTFVLTEAGANAT